MTHNKFSIWFGIVAITFGVAVGCKDKPQPTPADSNNTEQQQATDSTHSTSSGQASSRKDAPAASGDPKPTLRSIIANRRGWNPAYTNWYGRQSPDFKVTDITGKTHKLSEYKGRNVMLIFWATWCVPCLQEIPHLIELRNTTGESNLAMLAISFIGPRNSTETVKQFIAANPVINYTIISTDFMNMPSPYNTINAIPTTFFIDPDGKIKIATSGTIALSQIKAILEAEN